MSRFTAATGLVLLVTTALVGCTPAAEPEPEWTEESAYAAAEETFRAYWAAGAEGSDARAKFLSGEMQDVERDGEKELDELGIDLRGESTIKSVRLADFRIVDDIGVVELQACIDGTDVEVRQDGGQWRNPRTDTIYGVDVQLESRKDLMIISDLNESKDDQC